MIGSMALTSGTKLGPYEIKDKLGACVMGEVYRCRDSAMTEGTMKSTRRR